ncbi:HTH_Tnp_Tc3_2 domain-containing protein [Trichonephila clavipes]|nr:HTH_Tnp_Tc3_2 domain-containing protein [Trichonephila clavipes]
MEDLIVDSTPFTTLRHLVVPRETIRKLQDAGKRSRRPLKRIPLTPHHKQWRLEFFRHRARWRVTYWKRVIFSNEYRFTLNADDQLICL